MDWETISFAMSSRVRFKLLTSLLKSNKTPNQLSTEYNIAPSHISRAIKELEEKDLIKCLTPNRRKGKIFSITEKGKRVLMQIEKIIKD